MRAAAPYPATAQGNSRERRLEQALPPGLQLSPAEHCSGWEWHRPLSPGQGPQEATQRAQPSPLQLPNRPWPLRVPVLGQASQAGTGRGGQDQPPVQVEESQLFPQSLQAGQTAPMCLQLGPRGPLLPEPAQLNRHLQNPVAAGRRAGSGEEGSRAVNAKACRR